VRAVSPSQSGAHALVEALRPVRRDGFPDVFGGHGPG